jgi:hypothetical protein
MIIDDEDTSKSEVVDVNMAPLGFTRHMTGHNDQNGAPGDSQYSLPGLSVKDITKALESASKFCDELDKNLIAQYEVLS